MFRIPVSPRRWAAACAVLVLMATAGRPWKSGNAAASDGKRGLLAGAHRPAVSTEWPRESVPRVSRPGAAFVPGYVVVKFEPTVSARSMETRAREVGARAVVRPSYADFVYLELPPDMDPPRAAATLSGRPDVVYAEPDPPLHTKFLPNDPLYRFQWNFQKLDMERAWEINPGADPAIVVAVLDSGLAYLDAGGFARAPDLAGTHFVPGYDFIWDDAEPVDLDGHGTHVSGTIAQTTDNAQGVAGMAFNVSLMPVKVVPGEADFLFGAPFVYGASTLARGIRFAVANRARVINMSLGSYFPSVTTEQAIRDAVAGGVFIAIAAGNEAVSCEDCPAGIGPNPVEYPAKYAEDIDGAMAVGALDFNLQRAFYSNFQSYVEIAAPGGDLRVDLNRDGFADGIVQQTLDPDFVEAGIFNRFSYQFFMGTSMATPHVAGFAALLMHQGVRSPAAVEAAIKRFAIDVAPAGRDPFTGHGVLNPRGTLLGLGLLR